MRDFNCWPSKAEYDDLKAEGLLLGYLLAAKQDWETHDIRAFRGLFKKAYRNLVLDYYKIERRRLAIIGEHQHALVQPDVQLDMIHNVDLLHDELTERQYQILTGLYQGYTYRQLSDAFDISIAQISRERKIIQRVATDVLLAA